MIQFDEYFWNGLVQPPSNSFLAYMCVDGMIRFFSMPHLYIYIYTLHIQPLRLLSFSIAAFLDVWLPTNPRNQLQLAIIRHQFYTGPREKKGYCNRMSIFSPPKMICFVSNLCIYGLFVVILEHFKVTKIWWSEDIFIVASSLWEFMVDLAYFIGEQPLWRNSIRGFSPYAVDDVNGCPIHHSGCTCNMLKRWKFLGF